MSLAVELSKLNHYKNLAQWQQEVKDFRRSGMTVRAWCAQREVSEKTYYYRQRKVWELARQEQGKQALHSHCPPGKSSLPAIIPCSSLLISKLQGPADIPALVLRHKTRTVKVAADCNPELLRLALRAVK